MKIQIESQQLLGLLDPLQAVINDSHPMPIYQAVKVDILGDKINVLATNGEIDCINSIDWLGTKQTSFCVNYNMLTTALKSIKEQAIEVDLKPLVVTIYHKDGDFQIPLEELETFPEQPTLKLTNKVSVNGKKLKNSLKIANKFVLNSDLEPMSNISIEFGKKLVVRSTNRHSLYKESIKSKGDQGSVLMSGKASAALFSLLDDEDVKVHFDKERLSFTSANRKVTVLQQQGDFPIAHFDRILDSIKKASFLKVDSKNLVSSIKRTSALSSREKLPQIKFTISKKSIDMMCDNKGMSTKAQETLPAEFDKKLSVAFNPKLLLEILSVFDNPEYLINESNCFMIKSGKSAGMLSPQKWQE